MQLEAVIQSEVSQKEKKQIINIYMWNPEKKNGIDDLICKIEAETQT